MIKKILLFSTLYLLAANLSAQPTFKAGWDTYKTGVLVHEYTYNYTVSDSLKMVDSTLVFCTQDSMVMLSVSYPFRDKYVYKTASYYNARKQLIKTEEYKNDNLVMVNEWRYDDKNRKTAHFQENKVNGNNYKKNYDYSNDKKTGEVVASESSYVNGRIEFYTKTYYDKSNQKYKEVRLNDNNKDVVHIETFFYGENGKLRERSVYFPEWKVTKKFQEKEGNIPAKCSKLLPLGVADKVVLNTRTAYLKKFFARNQVVLMDNDCDEFEYKFTNGFNCQIIIRNTKLPHMRQMVYRFKERMP